jgi:hypothetical protein
MIIWKTCLTIQVNRDSRNIAARATGVQTPLFDGHNVDGVLATAAGVRIEEMLMNDLPNS